MLLSFPKLNFKFASFIAVSDPFNIKLPLTKRILQLEKEIYGWKYNGGTRISGIQDLEDKDIILGWLLRVHTNNPASSSGKCGKVFRQNFETFGGCIVCNRSCQQWPSHFT